VELVDRLVVIVDAGGDYRLPFDNVVNNVLLVVFEELVGNVGLVVVDILALLECLVEGFVDIEVEQVIVEL
jgi:hypothetical protein